MRILANPVELVNPTDADDSAITLCGNGREERILAAVKLLKLNSVYFEFFPPMFCEFV